MRKALSKKLRFEVFKRDNFTCQYCGAQSPDVVLQVDHINPVANGGENDILNLVTSCEACNQGKGARELSDNTAIAKQRAQLEELNARREQLEMMLEWREGLASLDEEQVDAYSEALLAHTGCELSDVGRKKVAGWLKRHSLADLLSGLDAAVGTYYKDGSDDPDENNRLAGEAINKTVTVLNARKKYADKPYMKELFYARAIVRNRMYCNDKKAIDLLERAFELGAHTEELKDFAKEARSWTKWRDGMEDWIADLEAGL